MNEGQITDWLYTLARASDSDVRHIVESLAPVLAGKEATAALEVLRAAAREMIVWF